MNENIINIKIKDYISKLLKIKKINELFNIRLFDIPEFIKEKEYIYTLIYKFIYIKRILLKENNIINNSLIKELLDFEIYLLLKYPLLITTLYTNDSIYNKYINNTKYNLFIKKKILALLYMLKWNDDITTHNEHIFINNVWYKINNDLIEWIYDTDKIIHLEIENYINLELLDIYNKLYENNRIIEHYNKYKEWDIIVEINELSDKINNKLQILNNNSKILLNNVYIIELYSNSILYYIVYSQHL